MKKKYLFLVASSLLVLTSCNNNNASDSSSKNDKDKLDAPVISLAENVITWDAITNASGYRVYENGSILYNHINKNIYEISVEETGTYTYQIVAFNQRGLYEDSDKSNEVSYSFSKPVELVAPVISLIDKTVSWATVEGATSYNIYSNGEFLIEVTATSYTLSFSEVGGYNIQVQAKRGVDVSSLSNAVVYKNVDGVTLNTSTSWNRNSLYDEWTKSGDFDTGVGEGFDMKAGATAFIYHAITNDTKFLKVSIRNFVREGETNPKFYVYIDGIIVKAEGWDEKYVTLNSDSPIDFIYDLSVFIGQNVFIKFYEAAATHCCITAVALLEKAAASLSENTSWTTKDTFFADWYTSSVSSTIGEGPDFAGNGKAQIKIAVTEAKRYLTVEWRMFNGQDTEEAHVTVTVNKDIVKANGVATDYAVVRAESGDPHFTYVYDLNAYIGQTVTITLASVNSKVNHCVFLKALLSASIS